jgi:oligopeptide/dipeptide ABC transporter ATP-binding protein
LGDTITLVCGVTNGTAPPLRVDGLRIDLLRPRAGVDAAPGHPYTQALLSGVLQADPTSKRVPIPLASTETADPLHVPPGCRFSNRCPHAMDVCRVVDPANVPHADGWVACHLYSGAGTGSPALREAVIHA